MLDKIWNPSNKTIIEQKHTQHPNNSYVEKILGLARWQGSDQSRNFPKQQGEENKKSNPNPKDRKTTRNPQDS